jgi:hypothetical protein
MSHPLLGNIAEDFDDHRRLVAHGLSVEVALEDVVDVKDGIVPGGVKDARGAKLVARPLAFFFVRDEKTLKFGMSRPDDGEDWQFFHFLLLGFDGPQAGVKREAAGQVEQTGGRYGHESDRGAAPGGRRLAFQGLQSGQTGWQAAMACSRRVESTSHHSLRLTRAG